MSEQQITVRVNDVHHELSVSPRTTAVEVLRDTLGLRATRVGCQEGECGSCMVLVDGEATVSCCVLAVQLDGREVTTFEHLVEAPSVARLRDLFVEHHALQCGFCTSGLVVSLTQAKRAGMSASEVQEDVLEAHLCRCTGYAGLKRVIESYWSDGETG